MGRLLLYYIRTRALGKDAPPDPIFFYINVYSSMSPNPEFALMHGKYLYYADLILDPKIEENLRNSDLKYQNADWIDEDDLIEIIFHDIIEVTPTF